VIRVTTLGKLRIEHDGEEILDLPDEALRCSLFLHLAFRSWHRSQTSQPGSEPWHRASRSSGEALSRVRVLHLHCVGHAVQGQDVACAEVAAAFDVAHRSAAAALARRESRTDSGESYRKRRRVRHLPARNGVFAYRVRDAPQSGCPVESMEKTSPRTEQDTAHRHAAERKADRLFNNEGGYKNSRISTTSEPIGEGEVGLRVRRSVTRSIMVRRKELPC
jgi:hypothetical protein